MMNHCRFGGTLFSDFRQTHSAAGGAPQRIEGLEGFWFFRSAAHLIHITSACSSTLGQQWGHKNCPFQYSTSPILVYVWASTSLWAINSFESYLSIYCLHPWQRCKYITSEISFPQRQLLCSSKTSPPPLPWRRTEKKCHGKNALENSKMIQNVPHGPMDERQSGRLNLCNEGHRISDCWVSTNAGANHCAFSSWDDELVSHQRGQGINASLRQGPKDASMPVLQSARSPAHKTRTCCAVAFGHI